MVCGSACGSVFQCVCDAAVAGTGARARAVVCAFAAEFSDRSIALHHMPASYSKLGSLSTPGIFNPDFVRYLL
jgi:hypothetical protein